MGRFTIGSLESVLKTNWVDLFPVARSLGFDCVELGVRGDDYLWTELWTAEGLRALKDRSEQAHIPIASICLHTFWKYTFANGNVSHRTTAKQIAFKAYDACRELGAGVILVPLTNPLKLPPEQAAQRWSSETRAIADGAGKAGVKIALEVVGGSHVITGNEVMELLDAIDHPSVGVYFDFGNAMSLGSDPVKDIGILGDRIFQVHVKDPKKDRTPCYLGEGDVNLSGCLKALIEIDYVGPLVFETPPLSHARDTAERNLKTLRGLIEETGA